MSIAIARTCQGPADAAGVHAGFQTLGTMHQLRRYNQWLWNQLSPHIGERVLEAGCGTGTFTRFLANRQRLVALDVDRRYVSLVKAQFSGAAHVRCDWIDLRSSEWPDLRDEQLDTVVSMNVLEHLPDDEAVLRRFWDLLDPGGRLVLLVPAHPRLFGTIDEALGHFRRYERTGLTSLLSRVRFELQHIRYLNPTGVLGWFINSRLLGRSVVPRRQAGLYDRIYPLLSPLDRLGLPFGLSVLAIARKPLQS